MQFPPHQLKIVLVEREIPQNAGNIARLCAVTGAALHLVRPLGFFLSEKHWKRAGMDYLEKLNLVVHDDIPALRLAMGTEPYWLCSARAQRSIWKVGFATADWLVFGKETAGLPANWLREACGRVIGIPMLDGSRCLNVSTAAGVVLYEAIRQATLPL